MATNNPFVEETQCELRDGDSNKQPQPTIVEQSLETSADDWVDDLD